MSVQRSPNGKGWRVRWHEHGRQPSRASQIGKRDAEAFDRDITRRRQLGPLAVQQLTTRSGPTLGQWIVERWAPEHGITLEQSTRDRYANVPRCHIAPWLDDVPLGEIGVALLRAWQAELVKAGVNPGTIHKAKDIPLERPSPRRGERGDPGQSVGDCPAGPKPGQRDAVQPPSPVTVEAIRCALFDPRLVRWPPLVSGSASVAAMSLRHPARPRPSSATR